MEWGFNDKEGALLEDESRFGKYLAAIDKSPNPFARAVFGPQFVIHRPPAVEVREFFHTPFVEKQGIARVDL